MQIICGCQFCNRKLSFCFPEWVALKNCVFWRPYGIGSRRTEMSRQKEGVSNSYIITTWMNVSIKEDKSRKIEEIIGRLQVGTRNRRWNKHGGWDRPSYQDNAQNEERQDWMDNDRKPIWRGEEATTSLGDTLILVQVSDGRRKVFKIITGWGESAGKRNIPQGSLFCKSTAFSW